MLLDPAGCPGDSGLFRFGGGNRIELPSGEWNCSLNNDSVLRNHDVLGQFNANYDDFIDEYTAASPPAADLDGDGFVDREEYLAQTAGDGQTYEDLILGQSPIPFVETTRERVQGELNFEIGDSVLQFLGMYVDETYQRWFEVDQADSFPVITMGMLGMNVFSMSDPTTIIEKYGELRWVSPGDKKFRYTLSGSYYTYDFHTDVYVNYGAIGHDLMLPGGGPVSPRRVIIISNNTTNYGAAFGLQYDLTDRTTLSFEGRYQNDENCGIDETLGVTDCVDANSFAPRLAINTAISDNHSIYAQISQGTNPGGVNIIYSNPDVVLSLDVASGRIPVPDLAPDGFTVPVNAGVLYDGVGTNPPPVVDYGVDTFQYYDEEELTNFEIGSKGVYGGGRGSYSVALYYMLWDKNISGRTLDWDDVTPEGWNAGDWSPQSGARTFFNEGESILTGIEFETDFHFNDVWSVGGHLALQDATFDSYCTDEGPLYTTSATPPFETVLPVLTPEADGVRANCSVVDGNTIPRTSDITGQLYVRATLPNDILGFGTNFRADLRHTGAHFTDDMNLIERQAVSILNLSMNMRNDDLGLTLRLYVNNVTDEDDPINLGTGNFYTDNANPTIAPSSVRAWEITPRRPREIGLTAIYQFQ
jgi:opacity protein-like surface antigen